MPSPCATQLPRARTTTRRARRVLTGLLAAATIATATGCASGSDSIDQPASAPTTTTSTATPSPSAPASASTAPASATPAVKVSDPEVDSETLKVHGKERVALAWAFSTDFARQWGFNPTLLDKAPQDLKISDFDGLRRLMTDRARTDFDKSVPSMRSHDARGTGFATAGMNSGGYTMREKDPVTDFVVDGSVRGEGNRLVVTSRMRSTFHVVGTDGGYRYNVSKTVHLYLNGSGDPFRIDGYDNSITSGTPEREG